MKTKSSIVVALVLVAAAVVLLLSTFGWIPAQASRVVLSWQAIFGLMLIVSIGKRHYVHAGVFLVLFAYFMVPLVCRVYGWELPLARREMNGLLVAALILIVAWRIVFGAGKLCRRGKKFFEVRPNKEGVPQISCAFVVGDLGECAIFLWRR